MKENIFILKEKQEAEIPGKNITDVNYADDIALLANTYIYIFIYNYILLLIIYI